MSKISNKIMTELLSKTCVGTGKPIKVGEMVKLYDWGMSGNVLVYGKFYWDDQHKKFSFEVDKDINEAMGIDDFSGIDGDELYKAGAEKLSKKELDKITPYL